MSSNEGNISSTGQNFDTGHKGSPDSAEMHSPEKSIVNMSDALDAGSAMDKQKSMRKIQEKMQRVTRTVYNPDSDPQFFLFLNRLADAEEFKKTDRIDGRRALNDFILSKESIMYVKGVKKAENVKRQHQEQLKLKGLWKESDDDPFTNLKETFTEMVNQKQTQEDVPSKMIDPKTLSKDEVRTKNIIKAVPTTNRGPKPEAPAAEDAEGADEEIKAVKDPLKIDTGAKSPGMKHGPPTQGNSETASPNATVGKMKTIADNTETLSQGPFMPGQAKHTLQGSPDVLIEKNESSEMMNIEQKNQTSSKKTKPFAAGASLDLHTQSLQSQAPMHQSSRALGISTLQLEPDNSHRGISVSKRATNMSGLGAGNISGSGSQTKNKFLRPAKSLIARIQIPAMDAEKAKQFRINSTLNLSERSPLIKNANQEKQNMYARMPTIFAKNKDSEGGEGNSIINLNPDEENPNLSQVSNPITGIAQLVEEGGSAAYQLYQQQSEKMLRNRLIEQNNGVFMANVESIKLARNESLSRVMMPKDFSHEKSLVSPLPQALNETALEQEIKKIVEKQSATLDNAEQLRKITVAGYEDMKLRLSPRHARLSNHDGHNYLREQVNSKLNILQRLEQQVIDNDRQRRETQAKENTFGLGMTYIQTRKRSVQPGMMTRALSPIAQNSEKSDQSLGGNQPQRDEHNWIDPRFVVVFAKDGDTLGSCKSFKMNIQEIISKYEIKQPSYMKQVTVQHQSLKNQFEKRAYKELLEFCSDHLFDQKEEEDPARRQQFKTVYTLDGKMLETLHDLKSYCEEEPFVETTKKVTLREQDELNDREAGEVNNAASEATKVMKNKASFIFNPVQNDLAKLAEDRDFSQLSPRNLSNSEIRNVVAQHGALSHNGSELGPNTLMLNQSSTRNVLPNITRNESEMQSLRGTSLRIDQQEEMEQKAGPKILLLSKQKNEFKGLLIPSEEDEDMERRANAKRIKLQIGDLKREKGNELYLEWLERNQENVDVVNKKLSLNLHSNDRALVNSNVQSRANLRNNLNMRRYTTDATLQPPGVRPTVVQQKSKFAGNDSLQSLNFPQIGGRQFNLQTSRLSMPPNALPQVEFEMQGADSKPFDKNSIASGRWHSRAVLRALDGVQRAEMFESLRKANGQNTITKKMAVLNATPNTIIKKKLPEPAVAGTMSQRLPTLDPGQSSLGLLGADPLKPPTLKQLRMEAIQRQIIEKTNAGLPIGSQMIDQSTVILRGMGGAKCTFGGTKNSININSTSRTSKKFLGNANNNGSDPGASGQRNLTYDEVKALSDEYFLPCKNVYELHAEFNSLMSIAQQEKLNSSENQEDSLSQQNAASSPAKDAGIPVEFFLRQTILLKDKHPSIQIAILTAMGIHTQNKQQVNISWIQFLKMHTLLSIHCATKAQYIDFWVRFMNPGSKKFVPREEFEERMELLARGSFTDKQTLISVNFAKGIYQVFAALNCLSKEEKSLGDINFNKVKKRLNSEALHIEYLNQTLKKDCEFILDEDMMAEGEIKIRKLYGEEGPNTNIESQRSHNSSALQVHQ